MIKMRMMTFESNSSSMHSFVKLMNDAYFTPEEIRDSLYVRKDGSVHMNEFDLQYGRSPFDCLYTFWGKFSYCIAALVNTYGDEKWDELEEILKKYVPEVKTLVPAFEHHYGEDEGYILDTLYEYEEKLEMHGIVRELHYSENKNGSFTYTVPDTGYAEDYGKLKIFLMENGISLEEFLTNKRYIIIVDGDEHCVFYSLKNAGLINMSAIKEENVCN